ncbi:helix-turn-helix domain-containing protein [Pseudooceanicola sp.]|uniref:helix-turn-helix domain-containing protein n=1 Tax=Pseudooceanicola sp. TaxID=1914328 RepID=UPI003511F1FC
MSHEATHWLAKLPADQLSASEFRILFHLCDCHNPAAGCFPTQAYLMQAANVSNGTLNNALRALEQKGIIRRQKRYDDLNKKSLPTRYVLGYEIDKNLSPKNGDSVGPDSNLEHDQTPISTTTRLQPTGDITCKEPGKEPVRGSRKRESSMREFPEDWKPDEDLVRWAWSEGFTDFDIELETKKLILNDAGKRHASLGKRFKAWMLKEKGYRQQSAARGGHFSSNGKAFSDYGRGSRTDPLLEYGRERNRKISAHDSFSEGFRRAANRDETRSPHDGLMPAFAKFIHEDEGEGSAGQVSDRFDIESSCEEVEVKDHGLQ